MQPGSREQFIIIVITVTFGILFATAPALGKDATECITANDGHPSHTDLHHNILLNSSFDQLRSAKLLKTARAPHERRPRTKQIRVAPGGIECGRWLRVQVQCRGPDIKVWVNLKLIFDITDPDAPRHGGIRLGSQNAVSQFRNLKVKTPTGDTQTSAPTAHPIKE